MATIVKTSSESTGVSSDKCASVLFFLIYSGDFHVVPSILVHLLLLEMNKEFKGEIKGQTTTNNFSEFR